MVWSRSTLGSTHCTHHFYSFHCKPSHLTRSGMNCQSRTVTCHPQMVPHPTPVYSTTNKPQNQLLLCYSNNFYVFFVAHFYYPNVMPAVIPDLFAHSIAGTFPSSERARLIRIRPPFAWTVTPSSDTDTTSPGMPVPSTRELS